MEDQRMANLSRLERLDTIVLKGKVIEQKEGQSVTLDAQGALLTIAAKDIKDARDSGPGEKELVVAADAKIIYETIVRPIEAEGILSKDAVVQVVGGLRYSGECECSRCTGGECECSRCVDRSRIRYTGECECSRCIGGECECSRCANVFSGFGRALGGLFRRRIG